MIEKEERRRRGRGARAKIGGGESGPYFSHLPKYLVGAIGRFSPLHSIANNRRGAKKENREKKEKIKKKRKNKGEKEKKKEKEERR